MRMIAVILLTLWPMLASAQYDVRRDVPCCHLEGVSGIVWAGTDSLLTFADLAAYCGPVLWFSPDEPLLPRPRSAQDIAIPMPFPFDLMAGGPVVHYRVRTLISRDMQNACLWSQDNLDGSLIDLSRVSAIDLDYFFYYPSEEGMGGHHHDVESVEMKLVVFRQPDCAECRYGISIVRATGKAHGVLWYDNTLKVDAETRLPLHILVEEGKHASCTDKNADGYYTPGYDVNVRVNDAWGVRDIISTGSLFGGGFQSWYAKVRNPRDRVLPPLPDDSLVKDGLEDLDGQRTYELRPFPAVEPAIAFDPGLRRFVDKGHPVWPELEEDTGVQELKQWFAGEAFVKSLSIAARFDDEVGISFVFPLLIVKNVNDPLAGGWLMNRVYLKDKNFRDSSWNILYSPSASRWVDGYFSAGFETDHRDDGRRVTSFMSEAGVKFRFDVRTTPLKFLTSLTDFWGVRAGIRYVGFGEFDEIGYAIEVGAGAF